MKECPFKIIEYYSILENTNTVKEKNITFGDCSGEDCMAYTENFKISKCLLMVAKERIGI